MKFNDIFGNAKWIKSEIECASTYFKGWFNCDKSEKTEIAICGLGFFKLYINGKKVGENEFAPVTSFYHDREKLYCRDEFGEKIRSRIYVEKYNISDYTVEGKNEISVYVGLGWYYEFGNTPILAYRIVNGNNVFVSDESVVSAVGPVFKTEFHRFEYHDYCCSSYDEKGCPLAGFENCVEAAIPDTEYFYNSCPNDRIIRSITPVLLKETNDTLIYDAGENITGVYVFTCDKPGKKITVTCGEAIDDDCRLIEKHIHGQISEFITDGSDREYRLQFTWAAFRYFEISNEAEVKRIDVIHTDVNPDSSFSCENGVLNNLYDCFIRTQLCNMHAGIPSDCPHLERRGYTGDGQLVCETALLTLNAKEFYLKWMEDISDCQDEISGHVQYTAPYHRCGGGPGGWGCAIATVPFEYYKRYGDAEPMKKYYRQALHYLDYLESHSENDLVVSDQPGLWCLGDWCTPHDVHAKSPDIPEPFVNTYFYIKTIDVLLESAEITGNEDKIEFLTELRKRKVSAINREYFNPGNGNYADNLNSANAFAVDIGLGDERTLNELIRHVREDVPDLGIFGIEIVTRILCERGYLDEVILLLSRREYPSYGFMFDNGATTLWEEWREPRSMSHPMFGAPVKQIFRYILGIRQKQHSYGMKEFIISPYVNDITGDAEGKIAVETGDIKISTDKNNGVYSVEIPCGVIAACKDSDGFIMIEKSGKYTFQL